MALYQSRQILAGYPVLSARDASGAVHSTADFLIPAAGLNVGDIIEMTGLEFGLVPLSARLATEKVDTGTTLTFDCGYLSGVYGAQKNADGTPRTMGNEFFAGSAVGQTGGIQDANKATALLALPVLDLLSIGLKVVTAPAGVVVGARMRLNVTSHAMPPAI